MLGTKYGNEYEYRDNEVYVWGKCRSTTNDRSRRQSAYSWLWWQHSIRILLPLAPQQRHVLEISAFHHKEDFVAITKYMAGESVRHEWWLCRMHHRRQRVFRLGSMFCCQHQKVNFTRYNKWQCLDGNDKYIAFVTIQKTHRSWIGARPSRSFQLDKSEWIRRKQVLFTTWNFNHFQNK